MWETKTFEELYLEPSRNGIYKPKEFHGRGCKIVNMGELFAYDFVGQQDMKRVELNEKELVRDTLKDGDILFGRRSLVESGAGKSSIVKNLNEPTTYESSVIRLRLNKKHSNPYFYYYWLLSPSGKGAIASIVTGANVKGIKSSDLKNIVVPTPTLPTQNKIVGILSAYDDLIENNLKRIKLLEKMAQITYEEWFVHLRFPGHESTPINPETGLPEGWSKTRLGEMCTLTMGQSPKSEFYNFQGKGLPFHQGVKDYGERFPTNACWSTSGSRYAERGDILFSVRAPVGRLNIALEKMILGRGLAAIRHKENAQGFLYCLLKKQFFEEDMMGGGAIFNSVTKNDMHRIEVVAPSPAILNDFNQIVEATDRQIEILHFQNVRLREARDILLPRLMTGVIDAESYDPAQLLKEAA